MASSKTLARERSEPDETGSIAGRPSWFVRALLERRLAAEDTLERRKVCRIFGRRICRALGAEHIRQGRAASEKVLMRRLLSFDYVLEHTGLPWLPTEPEKVGALRRSAPRPDSPGAWS